MQSWWAWVESPRSDADVLDLEDGVRQGPAGLVLVGVLAALDAVGQVAAEVDALEVDLPPTGANALQLKADVRARGLSRLDVAPDPDDVVAAKQLHRVVEH
jgi:hypothetical protein